MSTRSGSMVLLWSATLAALLGVRPAVAAQDPVELSVGSEPTTVDGRVLDPAGRPIEGARVHVDTRIGPDLDVFTDAEGRFLLRGRQSLVGDLVSIVPLEPEDGVARSLWIGEGTGGEDVRLAAGRPIMVRVEQGGAPAAGAVLRVNRARTEAGCGDIPDLPIARADAQGVLRAALPPGCDLMMRIGHPDGFATFVLPAAQPNVDLGLVELQLPARLTIALTDAARGHPELADDTWLAVRLSDHTAGRFGGRITRSIDRDSERLELPQPAGQPIFCHELPLAGQTYRLTLIGPPGESEPVVLDEAWTATVGVTRLEVTREHLDRLLAGR